MRAQDDEHKVHLSKARAAAIQGFYNLHGDERRWEPWEFEAEKHLLETVTEEVNREDGYMN